MVTPHELYVEMQSHYLVASWMAASRLLGGDFVGDEMTVNRTCTLN